MKPPALHCLKDAVSCNCQTASGSQACDKNQRTILPHLYLRGLRLQTASSEAKTSRQQAGVRKMDLGLSSILTRSSRLPVTNSRAGRTRKLHAHRPEPNGACNQLL